MGILQQLGIDLRLLVVTAAGFLVLVWFLRRFAFGPVLDMLQRRQDTIISDLDQAEARRKEMERLQQEYATRLAQIEDEARDRIQQAVKEAQAARDEILARAHNDSQGIVQRGHDSLERERAQAMVAMRNQIAELAIQSASRVMRETLDADRQSRIIDEIIDSLGAVPSQAGGTA